MPRDDRKARILERAEREKVKFMRLQFTDILGAIKNVEVPDKQFDDALEGRIMFDIANPDGTAFAGCPRSTLKRAIALAAERGFVMSAGPEAEFFLFQRRSSGEPTTETHDSGGYFDLTPVDLGEDVRREIILALEQMGFHVEAAHHEVAPGQHEIDFRHDDALITADNVSTFRFVVKNVATRHGLHATFMP